MKIGKNKFISNFSEPYVIAELGSNHNGDMDLARKLIDQAKESGCDAVKFQSWTKDTIFSKKVYQDNFFLEDDYRNRQDYALEQIVEEFSVSEQELLEMKKYCDKIGIDFSSTPFSNSEVDFLCGPLDASFIKVASMDLNNYVLLDYLARKSLPIMLSTGLSTLSEIDKAIQTIEDAGNRQIILLHCVSVYPPDDNEVNLKNMDTLRTCYPEYPVGFSDHTLGTAVPIAAVACGACVIEKHFTLDKSMFGWDHKVSATKEEMSFIVESSKRIVKALGSTRRTVSAAEKKKIPAFRRSIVAARTIAAGTVIKTEDLDLKRPGTGLEPEYFNLVVGRTAKRTIPADEMLRFDDF
jgi:N-acetylneuraminate synthase